MEGQKNPKKQGEGLTDISVIFVPTDGVSATTRPPPPLPQYLPSLGLGFGSALVIRGMDGKIPDSNTNSKYLITFRIRGLVNPVLTL